jgi:E3 ubiquitin-protein ligase RAD18
VKSGQDAVNHSTRRSHAGLGTWLPIRLPFSATSTLPLTLFLFAPLSPSLSLSDPGPGQMEHAFDLPDPSDWLNTPLSLLGPVENSLRCQVCKDFFDTPVITSCSHTFCSLCIRRCLSSEGKCPACRKTDQELKLRRNWVVQEVVEAFINARPRVLGLARKAQEAEQGDREDIEQPASKKRKVERSDAEGDEVAADPVSEGRQTRSQSKRVDQQTQTPTPEISGDGRDGEQIPGMSLTTCS